MKEINNIEELKVLFLNNKECFEEELPMGHSQRFNKRLNKKNNKRIGFLVISAIAASFLLGYIGIQISNFNAPEYEKLKKEISISKNEISEISLKINPQIYEESSQAINSIISESIPLEELLPAELTPKQKDAILTSYYKKKLDGLNRYKTFLTEEIKLNH